MQKIFSTEDIQGLVHRLAGDTAVPDTPGPGLEMAWRQATDHGGGEASLIWTAADEDDPERIVFDVSGWDDGRFSHDRIAGTRIEFTRGADDQFRVSDVSLPDNRIVDEVEDALRLFRQAVRSMNPVVDVVEADEA